MNYRQNLVVVLFPKTNELVIEGEAGDAIIDSYLRSGTVFPTKLFHSVTPKVVNFLPPNIDGNKFFPC